MKAPTPAPRTTPASTRGFALLITITLVAFLVLILVALASLTRVETQVASNSQQLDLARQNALMALNIAVGELQKYAGPDQRVTARSDLDSNLATTTNKSGRWTGVYGRGATNSADLVARDIYSDVPANISTFILDDFSAAQTAAPTTNGSQAVLLNWLVSGNEGTAFNPATMVDANGQIDRAKVSDVFAFTPDDAVNFPATPSALATDITITNSTGTVAPARLLVGPGSVSAASDYVAAPLKDITSVTPGLGTTAVPVGRYAWWVGDEGTKARINLPMPTSSEAPLAFVSAQRAAIELVDGTHPVGSTSAFASTDLIGAAYPTDATNTAEQAKLLRVIDQSQLPLINPSYAAALNTAVNFRHHDLTGYSNSVFSDVYAGGLKKDLSAILAPVSATGLSSPLDTDVIFPPQPNTSSTSNEFGLPTWGMLRDFAKTTAPTGGELTPRMSVIKLPTQKGTVIGTTPTSTSTGIHPVMTYSALGFQYGVPQTAALPADQVGNPIHLALFPVVVLWNPYTTDIQAAKYEFGIKKTYASLLEFQKRDSGATGPWSSANIMELRDFANEGKSPTGSASYFRFVIDSGIIPAGKSLVYTLQTNGTTNYDSSSNAALLANALKSTTYNPGGHVLLPSTLSVTATGATYRVGVNGATGTYGGTPVTFFTNTSCNFGGNINGGPGTINSYLGPFPPASPGVTTNYLPYTGSPTTGFTSQVYQEFAPGISAPFNSVSPYGNVGSGYAVSTGNNGLLQDESSISLITQPKFRMMNEAVFSAKSPTNSSSRWIVTTNPRGYVVAGTPSGGNSASSFFTGQPPASVGIWPQGISVKANPSDGGGPRVSAGTSLTDVTSGPSTTGGIVDATLFEFRPENQPLLSIGQLQHANLAWANGYPSYLIGNSAGWSATGELMKLTGGTFSAPAWKITASYDLSWLLNRALWDRYFVSSVPHTGTGKTGPSADDETTSISDPLPNPRHSLHDVSANDPDIRTKLNAVQAAAHLLLEGGFNVNSTSEQAWRAILGGMNELAYDPTGVNQGGTASSDAIISRFTKPTTNAPHTNAGDAWQGYRKLTPEQIAQLAGNIVSEVRRRGPFVSLGDFINHRLVDNGTFPLLNDQRLKGALQAAIDASPAVNSPTTAPFTTLVIDSYNTPTTNALKSGSSNGTAGNVTAPYSSTAAFAPQFLTQADILSAVGGGLTARSDTFTIRAYGETLNPTLSSTDAGYIAARAWCEAVVQRLPDYVDATTDADASLAPTAAVNKTMGRRFKIVSFRWLSPNDI